MKLKNVDAIQNAIGSINSLSTLVGRHCYGEDPEEADAAQRGGVAAIQKLRQLRDELEAALKDVPATQAPGDESAIAA
ncbi:MAG: hypothetical protein ACJ74Q_14955 [Pyrinomonadaceae bacterium]